MRFDYFAARVAGQRIDEANRARCLEVRQMFTGVIDHRFLIEIEAGSGDDERPAHFAQSVVRNPDHRDVGDTVEPGQYLLDLGGIDVEPAADVHVLEPVGDPQVARLIEDSDVSGV